jgi:hypothetical protein
MTRMLLRNRADQYSELEAANFERAVKDRFEVLDSEPLKGGTRKIYHLRPN